MQFYCLPLQSLTASDVYLIAASVEHHPSLRELTVDQCSESLVKGAVEGMARRRGVQKLGVASYSKGENLYLQTICSKLCPYHVLL